MPESRQTEISGLPILTNRLRKGHKFIAVVLLILASLHCARSIFFNNESELDLKAYASGTERTPFQERVAMMPLLAWAGQNAFLARAAALVDKEDRHQHGRQDIACAEPMSAEKLICLFAGSGCILVACWILFSTGKTLGSLQWLPAAIFLAILYASYTSRYEAALWYPYDLPHMLLFGTACLVLLDGPLWLFLLLFALDLPMRETSVYLAVLAFPVLWRNRGWKVAGLCSAAMLLAWSLLRVVVGRRFAHNPSETGARFSRNLHNLALPLHWPQMASLLGFLLLPVWLGRDRLASRHRLFLWAMLPCLAVTLTFGMWIESRIALEWSIPLAWFAAVELTASLGSEAAPGTA